LPEALGGGERVGALNATMADIASEMGDCESNAEMVEMERQALQHYWSNLLAKSN
jgi:hypothetical protein